MPHTHYIIEPMAEVINAFQRPIRTLLRLALLGFLAKSLCALSAELPDSVSKALKEAGISSQNVAVVVQAVDADTPIIRHNELQAMNPASTSKLLTTYAALELLGPAYTWKTDALADATPGKGLLNGNLYLRGSGDPKLTLEQFWLLLRQLRTRGISEINGDLVLDRSAFALPTHDAAAFDNEPLRPYNAGPDALLVNLKSVRLSLMTTTGKNSVQVTNDTPSDDVRVDNRLQLTQEGCGDWREKIKTKISGLNIELTGSYSANCGEKALYLSPWSPNTQVEQLFRALWRELGGTLRGKVRDGLTPASARNIATLESPALSEIIRDINKFSNNVMARQVFLTLAAQRPATAEGARQRINTWLNDKGLNIPALILDNGSGLSRMERISAEGLSQLLLAAWKSPVMPELMSSLPVAGIDGTLKKRLRNGATAGRAHLKTGYLDNVRAIAGYVLDSNDKRWVVVFLINDPKSRSGKPAMDEMLRWVAEH